MNPDIIAILEERFRNIIREELKILQLQPIPAEPIPEFIHIDKAEIKYGCKRSFLHRLSSDRKVSTKTIGKFLHFNVEELEAYFNSKIKKSSKAINKELDEKGAFQHLAKRIRGSTS